MDLLATLLRSGGVEALARQAQVKSKVAIAASEALLPSLIVAMQRFVRAHGGGREGLARLIDLLSEHGDGALASLIVGPEKASPLLGEDLIDRFFAGDDTEALLLAAAKAGKVKVDVIETIWPLLVMLVGGYIAARAVATGDPADLGDIADLLARS